MNRAVNFTSLIAGAVVLCAFAPESRAASIIRDPNPPKYGLEIEPHLNVQYFYRDKFGGHGFGPGIRFGIPLMSPGFIKKINDSVALSFGGDFLYLRPLESRCDNNGCYEAKALWGFYSPVTLQWNFWLTEKWSAFGEAGPVLRTPFGTCERSAGCKDNESPIWFSTYVGGRYHFGDSLALTMRAGYPTGFSVGLSIF